MKLTTFKLIDHIHLGIRLDDSVIQLDNAYDFFYDESAPPWLHNMRALLEEGNSAMDVVRGMYDQIRNVQVGSEGYLNFRQHAVVHHISEVKILAPILDPEKLICIGRNYRDHCEEQGHPIPDRPTLFSKFNTAIIATDDFIVKPRITEKLDYEGELAFVIGKGGRHIRADRAMEHIAGYTILHDVTARDIQFSDKQWLRGKSFDTFAPMGPFLVTKDEVGNPHKLNLKTFVNGKLMQDSNTSNLIFQVDYLIYFISQAITLKPGDVIATGTPGGVGVFRDPPIFLKAGDEIEIKIDKLGSLKNTVVDE
ncbi:fumarylacetoacetate hydrolase family protein [bacterium]|nr:fumarylacetoacetate hydrolase family protein [bacterium]